MLILVLLEVICHLKEHAGSCNAVVFGKDGERTLSDIVYNVKTVHATNVVNFLSKVCFSRLW